MWIAIIDDVNAEQRHMALLVEKALEEILK